MQKPEIKFDFKKEASKMWNAIVRFLKPFRNLDKELLTPSAEPFLKKHIQMVYTIGCIILVFLAVLDLRFFPNIFAILGKWIVLVVIFVMFRLLCELISDGKKTKK